MAVSTYAQTDHTSQTVAAYPGTIDADFAVLHQLAGAFAPHQTASPASEMKVAVDGGTILAGSTRITKSLQTTATITAPTTHPRHDLVVIAQGSGDVAVVTGAEAASPADPVLPAGTTPVARVRLATATTAIANADLDDLRPLWLTRGWVVKTAAYTASADDRIEADSASGAFTLTLPAAPSTGAELRVRARGAATHTLTIGRNGQTIMALAEDMTVVTDNVEFALRLDGATWRVFQ
ncbi:MAG: hypothetical protein HY985_11255 [Magnetospirillum sp.]|nr:hypothetical protein [Magnetospirillum sp.]